MTDNPKNKTLALGATILAILLCIGAAGYMVWATFGGGSDESRVVGTDDPPANHRMDTRMAMGKAMRANQPDGVHDKGGNVTIKAGSYQMWVMTKQKNGPAFFLMPLNQDDLVKPEDMEILTLRRRVREAAVAAHMNITKDQQEKLRKVNAGGGGMVILDSDQKLMADTWKGYESATGAAKTAAEKTLTDTVKQVADRSVEPTKKAVADRVAAMRAILSDEQIQLFRTMGK